MKRKMNLFICITCTIGIIVSSTMTHPVYVAANQKMASNTYIEDDDTDNLSTTYDPMEPDSYIIAGIDDYYTNLEAINYETLKEPGSDKYYEKLKAKAKKDSNGFLIYDNILLAYQGSKKNITIPKTRYKNLRSE